MDQLRSEGAVDIFTSWIDGLAARSSRSYSVWERLISGHPNAADSDAFVMEFTVSSRNTTHDVYFAIWDVLDTLSRFDVVAPHLRPMRPTGMPAKPDADSNERDDAKWTHWSFWFADASLFVTSLSTIYGPSHARHVPHPAQRSTGENETIVYLLFQPTQSFERRAIESDDPRKAEVRKRFQNCGRAYPNPRSHPEIVSEAAFALIRPVEEDGSVIRWWQFAHQSVAE
jgi:hypothetical protein